MSETERPSWLEKYLSTLPREMDPRRDLWPDIARRLDAPGRRNWIPAAVAASLILSAISALFTWHLYEQRQADAAALIAAREYIRQIESPYLQARHTYEAQWPVLRGQLEPETAVLIERNLEIIRKANAELSRALERQPDSTGLQRLLRQTLAKEVDVYQRALGAARHAT